MHVAIKEFDIFWSLLDELKILFLGFVQLTLQLNKLPKIDTMKWFLFFYWILINFIKSESFRSCFLFLLFGINIVALDDLLKLILKAYFDIILIVVMIVGEEWAREAAFKGLGEGFFLHCF